MQTDPTHRFDKLALFLIMGMLVVVLGGVSYGLISRDVSTGSVGIIGTIVGIIGSRIGETIKAVQASWEAVQWGKMTDKLASSPGDTQSVKVVNESDHPIPTHETVDGA